MSHPAEQAGRSEPKRRREDEPEDGSEKISIVHLPHSGDEKTQYRCDSGLVHKYSLINNMILAASVVLRKRDTVPYPFFSPAVPLHSPGNLTADFSFSITFSRSLIAPGNVSIMDCKKIRSPNIPINTADATKMPKLTAA
jgi:hypothetical protein